VIDLAFVNDRIFVNNVSLGIYAEIVSPMPQGYKLRQSKMLPELLQAGCNALRPPLRGRTAASSDGPAHHRTTPTCSTDLAAWALGTTRCRPARDRRSGDCKRRSSRDSASLNALRQLSHFEVGSVVGPTSRLRRAGGRDRHRRRSGCPRTMLRFTIVPGALTVLLPPTAPASHLPRSASPAYALRAS
jgi:hypothetical protein